MAEPVCTITQVSYSGSTLDLTALTEPTGVYDPLGGDTGADWYHALNYASGAEPYRKKYGGEQIQFARFWDSGDPTTLTMSTPNLNPSKTWTAEDEVSNGAPAGGNSSPRLVIPNGTNGCGIRYTMPSDTKLRRFRWYGSVYAQEASAVFQVRATLSDGSVAMQTATLTETAGGESEGSWFNVAFRSTPGPDKYITIDVRCHTATTTGGTFSFILFPSAVLDVAVAPPKPRGFANIIQYLGRFGGPNT